MLMFNFCFPCIGDNNLASDMEIICGFIKSVVDSESNVNITVIIVDDFNVDLLFVSLPDYASLHTVFLKERLQPCTKLHNENLNLIYIRLKG